MDDQGFGLLCGLKKNKPKLFAEVERVLRVERQCRPAQAETDWESYRNAWIHRRICWTKALDVWTRPRQAVVVEQATRERGPNSPVATADRLAGTIELRTASDRDRPTLRKFARIGTPTPGTSEESGGAKKERRVEQRRSSALLGFRSGLAGPRARLQCGGSGKRPPKTWPRAPGWRAANAPTPHDFTAC